MIAVRIPFIPFVINILDMEKPVINPLKKTIRIIIGIPIKDNPKIQVTTVTNRLFVKLENRLESVSMLFWLIAVRKSVMLDCINFLSSCDMIAGNKIPKMIDTVINIVNSNSSLFCFSSFFIFFINSPLYTVFFFWKTMKKMILLFMTFIL